MIVVLLGGPGAGKGTQAVALAEGLAVPHVSTGELFRGHLKERTALGLEAEGYMSRGELVPDTTVIGMVRDRLQDSDAAAGAVLDGFPRTVAQAEALDAMLCDEGRALPHALDIDVPEEALVRRLTGRRVCGACGATYHVEFKPTEREGVCDACGGALVQRDDDSAATVRNRLAVYERETAPVSDFYRERGRLSEVDGDAAPAEVGRRLADAVRALAS